MASIEYITKRIEGKKAEITKLEKKLARIMKAKESDYEENNPYGYSDYDLKWVTKDIEEAKNGLTKYEAELATATEKAESRNVAAIIEFLEGWKNRMREWYGKGLEEYYSEKAAVRSLHKETENYRWGSPEYTKAHDTYEEARKVLWHKVNGYFEKVEVERNGRKREVSQKVRDGELEYTNRYNEEQTLMDAMNKLEKDLTKEAERKYDFIIERVNYICGTITDAAGLRVGPTGDLNGFIKGERGTAKVQTIGAGGYNIQCFQFRTLIHEMK